MWPPADGLIGGNTSTAALVTPTFGLPALVQMR
jgi:hypothetical protein